ncbi:MAG TPA: diacylglycerol kinase family protein [bacterium]|jgi:diacylglycerol kinase|nr:diacylglycerol kinase family protein [bacterium]
MSAFRLFLRSMRHALRGISDVAKAEQSFRLQLAIALLTLGLAIILPLLTWERILVLLLCSAVLVLEILNSIMERFADAVQPRLSPMVREVKDMMAGAVFLTAVTAGVIGVMIFYPHFYNLACAILESCGGR